MIGYERLPVTERETKNAEEEDDERTEAARGGDVKQTTFKMAESNHTRGKKTKRFQSSQQLLSQPVSSDHSLISLS